MFERFTENAIKVIMLSHEEARRLRHNYVGTEFILLGLLGEKKGIAGKALNSAGVNLKNARIEVEKIVGKGSGFIAIEIPFTPSAKRMLELAWDEARELGVNHIGTEHLLLSLTREIQKQNCSESTANILETLGVDLAQLRKSTIEAIGKGVAYAGQTKAPKQGEVKPYSPVITGAMHLVTSAIVHAKEAAIVEKEFELAAWLRQYETEFSEKIGELFPQRVDLSKGSEEADLSDEISVKENEGSTSPFSKFTEKAIQVIMLAQGEARRVGHNFVGTEQILLGLIGEGTSVAAKALKSMKVNLKEARVEVEKIIGRGSGFVAVEIPFTPRAKRVLEYSMTEAQKLGHNYIGPEHLLLGLIREGEGVAVRVLENLGADGEKLRGTLMRYLGEGGTDPA